MNRYHVSRVLGDGTYGSVLRAQNAQTGELVAIKKMKQKYFHWADCMALREVKVLRKLVHINIVKLKEVIRENNDLHLVFEYVQANLYQLTKDCSQLLPERSVKSATWQMLAGLHHMHQAGFFHRDLKPENVLVSTRNPGSGGNLGKPEDELLVKLADFGLAREIRSRPPYTDYVSTRWYRAPEVLLRSTSYGPAVDTWALGAIVAELYTLRPLFPGSSESDQLYKVSAILGTPTQKSWPEGHRLAAQAGFRFPQFVPTALKDAMGPANCCGSGYRLMESCLQWDAKLRATTGALRDSAYFQGFSWDSSIWEKEKKEKKERSHQPDKGQAAEKGLAGTAASAKSDKSDPVLEDLLKSTTPKKRESRERQSASPFGDELLLRLAAGDDTDGAHGTPVRPSAGPADSNSNWRLKRSGQRRAGSAASNDGAYSRTPVSRRKPSASGARVYQELARYRPGMQVSPAGAASPLTPGHVNPHASSGSSSKGFGAGGRRFSGRLNGLGSPVSPALRAEGPQAPSAPVQSKGGGAYGGAYGGGSLSAGGAAPGAYGGAYGSAYGGGTAWTPAWAPAAPFGARPAGGAAHAGRSYANAGSADSVDAFGRPAGSAAVGGGASASTGGYGGGGAYGGAGPYGGRRGATKATLGVGQQMVG